MARRPHAAAPPTIRVSCSASSNDRLDSFSLTAADTVAQTPLCKQAACWRYASQGNTSIVLYASQSCLRSGEGVQALLSH